MDPIAVQTYVEVKREIDGIEKREFNQEHAMYLYQDRLITANHKFTIREVLDMSFRRMGDKGGLFYLHTDSGLYTYMVKSSPQEFIRMFKGY